MLRHALPASNPKEMDRGLPNECADFADVWMQSCLMGAPQIAEWMKQHPAELPAAWRCVIGKQDGSAA